MSSLRDELKEQNMVAFGKEEEPEKSPSTKVEGWIYGDSDTEIVKTADVDARNAVISQKASAYKGANPLNSSIEYLGISEGLINDDYYYQVKNKYGTLIFASSGHPLNEISGIRGEGFAFSKDDLDKTSDMMKKHILSLCPPVTQDENGKWRTVVYPQYGLASREKAEKMTQEYVGSNVCTYYASKAVQVYLEQNKANFSSDEYKCYKENLELHEKYAVANLQKCGITVNQQTGDMKRAATHTTNHQMQRDVVSR